MDENNNHVTDYLAWFSTFFPTAHKVEHSADTARGRLE